MKHAYPLDIVDYRDISEDFEGNVFIWDVDKTYLQTHFSSMQGLARIPFELAVDKKSIPGMPEVLRGLRRGPGPDFICAPIYFISASPPQMRSVIEHKMLRDGVEQDGITFKDWLKTVICLRPGRLYEQVGFKLSALLKGRQSRLMAKEYLFGDDFEKDALAFSLYARFLAGELSEGELDKILRKEGVSSYDRQGIQELAHELPNERGRVERIFIHLENNTSPEKFSTFGKRLVPVKGGLQLALALFNLNLVDEEAVQAAREAVVQTPLYRYGKVPKIIADAKKRKLISPKKLKSLGFNS